MSSQQAPAVAGLRRAIVFLGPPGAGKGTQAQLAAKELKIPHLSTGEMLRDHVARETVIGRAAKRSMESGELVPDDYVLQMVEERMSQPDCVNGFVSDGFPRTLVQAEKLDGMMERGAWRLPVVLHLVVDRKQLLRRMTGRRTCAVGGEIYNIYDNPPKVAGRCDHDGGKLIQRPDDREDVIAERLAVYDMQTRVLIDYYRRRDVLADVDGMATPAEVASRVQRVLASDR